MKVNERLIKKIVNVLCNACISASDVCLMPDTGNDEFIIRYQDENHITISLCISTSFGESTLTVGFLDVESRYKTFSTWVRIERSTEQIFFFELSGILHRCSKFALINYIPD